MNLLRFDKNIIHHKNWIKAKLKKIKIKFILTLFFILTGLFSFAQIGKIKLDLTVADTSKPYFLDIFINKKTAPIKRLTVTESGNYSINDLEEGYYNLELFSFESRSRRLKIDSVHVIKDSAINLLIIYPPPCKYIYPENYEPKCPFNHSGNIVKIMYGLPTRKLMTKAKKGLVHLGGCMITDCDPKFYCTLHKIEF